MTYLQLIKKTIKLSVKTRFLSNVDHFPLSKKDQSGCSDDFYYAFIRLNEFKKGPDFWIIPSKRVNEVIEKSRHEYFENRTRKDRKKHRDVGLRDFWVKVNKANQGLLPDNFEEELAKYYKNIEQLKQ